MSEAAAPDNRELLKRALRKLDELQSKLDAMEATQREPIAIVGLGCRFPRGGNDPAAFWRNLQEGVDGITEVPPDRWDVDAFYDPEPGVPGKMYVRHAGLLDQVDGFDPHFFGIAPREAPGTDPQQRLLLEIVWEALEDAGQAPDRLEGSPTGVFVGIGSFDYSQLQTRSGSTDLIDAYSASGMSHSVAAGRISYLLGLAGPAVAVDTACSSSLVAVHLACQSLRTGECEIALAGGVNLILSPDGSIATCQARMLAPDGRCKTFDGSADGYVRSEGCGIVVLKRLSAAIANRDHIRAVIRGTAINQDGRSSGLTAPNGPAQEAVIRQALERSGLQGHEISYVEAHGTGTSLGDPIELRALGAVLGARRPTDRPLGVGSVKTNIGHLEAAAGVAGLTKMVLALENEEIPPHLHFHTPNPHVPWDELPLEVVAERRPFPHGERRRIVGVSAFGFSGTNAHLVLEEAPPVAEAAAEVDRPQHLLCLSARDERVFRAQVVSFERHLGLDPEAPWSDVCFTANAGRSHLEERLAVRAASLEEGRRKLAEVMAGDEPGPGMWRGRTDEAGSPEVAFLFTGQGSQYAGMSRGLYETQPTYRGALERCSGILEGELERPLLEVLFGDSEEESVLGETGYTQPALFALEYALAELLRTWGIEPTIVLGHSVGEYVAACVAGVMGLEDGLRLIARRGRLMQSLPSGGAMTALEAPEDRIREALRGHEGEVSVAAVNAPGSVVISGVAEVVSEISRVLEAEGVRAQPLKVSHAFHSPLIEPILSDLESAAGELSFGDARIGIVSNLSGKMASPGELARADYWRRQARGAVRFAASIETLREQGIGAFVEVGPHPTLLGLAQRQVTDGRESWHPTLRRGQEDWSTLLDAVGGLYVRGVEVDWEGFDRDYRRRRVSLPTYPFERRRYWLESASRGARNTRLPGGGGGVVVHPLLGSRVRSPLSVISYEAELESGSPGYLSDYSFYGRVVFPAAGYAELGLAASREAFGAGPVRVEDLEIEEPLLLESDQGILVQTLVTAEEGGSARFEVFSALASEEEPTWRRHVRGRVGGGDGAGTSGEDSPVVSARERCGEEIPVERYYEEFREHGVEYGPGFRWLRRVWRGADEAVGELRRPEGVDGGTGDYLVHPGLLDGGIQLLGAALASRGDSDSAYMPVRLSGLRWHSSSPTVSLAHVKVGEGSGEGALRAELSFSDEDGRVWLEVGELELRRAPRSTLERAAGDPVSGWLYGLEWREQALEDAPVTESEPGGWLVLDDGGEVGAQLSARLVEAGERVMRVRPGDGTSDTCDPLDREGFVKRLAALCGGANGEGRVPLRGVVHLWGLDGGSSAPEEVSAEAIESALRVSGGGLMAVVQALAGREEGEAPRLYLVTRGAQSVGMPPSRLDLSASPLWGLARTVALEHPGLRPLRIDLDPGEHSLESLWREVRSVGDEDQVALRGGKRYVARLGRAAMPTSSPDEPVQLRVGEHGGLEGLDLVRIERRAPGAGEVEIEVEASGLNFRDVLNALGMYPGNAGPLGSECAGTVARVGSGVEALSEGDAVVALVPGAFASHATTRADMVARLPEGMGAEEAAGVPIAYLTAQYAFEALAGLKAGQKVLIHAAAGGVGMAAVHLARRAGAEVFGTAGNEDKRALLRELGVEHTLDSRSVSFAEEIMERTGGRGVDVVLNALSGEFIEKSLGLVAPGGCFVEIGKRGVWSEDRVRERFPGIRYHVFDLGEPLRDEPERVMGMLREVLSALKEADLGELPRTCFPLERARDAFRYMAQARHVGKIVLVRKAGARRSAIREDALYLVTGGLGGLGLEVARWLVERGARHLALLSRRPPNETARASVEALERAGARVRVGQVDVSDPEAVGRFLAEARADGGPPLRGILHAAGVIDDGVLTQQDWSRFERVLAPKLRGALALADHTRDKEMDFLVLFSSVASLLGSPGQGNYAMANAFLDALAHDLRARGRPALSINWGPWSRAGMAAGLDEADQRRRAAQGVDLLEPEEGCRALERLLDSDLVQSAVMPVDWSRFQRTLPEGSGRRFYEELATTAGGAEAPQAKTRDELRRRIEAAPPPQRPQIVHEHVRQQVTRVLGLDPDHPPGPKEDLTALGMDSLMAVELKNRLEATLGVSLPAAALLDEATVEALACSLLEKLGPVAPTPASLAAPIDARRDDERGPLRREGLAAHGPLSSVQRRLWFFHRFEPDSATYNMSLRFEMTGALDIGALQQSMTALVARHEALRTRFGEEGGEPFATVVESTPIACPIDDLRGMEEGAEAELERLLEQDEGQPFDLEQAPLLRARLVQMDDARSVLGLTMHHIASDGWSMGVLATDFLEAYESISRGQEPSLGPLPFRYRDHVAAERRWLESPAAQRQLEYWRGRLSGALPVVDLPRDYSRPRVQTYRGGTRAHRLSEGLTRRVAELSRAQGVTPFMTLLSAFALLLHRLTGLEDLPIGVPVAGRGRPETDGIVGVFINTVVMRHDLSTAPAFAELLARTRELALEAYDNAEVSFDRVVEALQPRRDPARPPLFQVLFNSIDFGGRRRVDLPDLTVDVSAADSGDSKFDLTLYVGPSEEGTDLMLSFNSDLYRPERMEGLLAQYESVLEQAVAHPEQPVSKISLVTESTRAILPDPTRPQEPWAGPSLTEPFLRYARRHPDRRAVVDVDGALGYGTVERLSGGLAGRLRAAGVSRGDVVALFCPRSRELVWGMLGVLRAGAGFVILDPDHPPARIRECLRVSKASAWLASPRLGDPDPALAEALERREWALRAELSPALIEGGVPPLDEGAIGSDDVAYVAFTSGTLGVVNGILGTHGPPAHFLSWQTRTFDLNAGDRFSLLSGLSHDPLLRDVFAPLHSGATLCVPDPDVLLMPSDLRRWLADEGVTVVHLTPSLAALLTEGADAGGLPALRYAFLGGEVLTQGVVDALRRLAPSVSVVNFYGATETPQVMAWHGVPSKGDDGDGASSIPIGRGIDDVQLLVLGQEGRLAGIGELGEIGVRTPHLARGYVDDEALTRERFISSPFSRDPRDRIYRTGDLGRYRPDGLVEYSGRRDGQVKVRGYRVEPGAIEQLLHDHAGVRQACVLVGGGASGAGGEIHLVAYLVLDTAEPPTVTELRRLLRAHVPDYMVPSLFVTLDAFPLTPNGKVDRSRLEASSASSLRIGEVRQPPRTEAEHLVAEVWKETLEIESVDVGDNFFDLGGHSLQAIRVLARIEERTGQRVNPRLMIYQPLERFAAGLEVGSLADSPGGRGERGPLRRLRSLISSLRPRAQLESS